MGAFFLGPRLSLSKSNTLRIAALTESSCRRCEGNTLLLCAPSTLAKSASSGSGTSTSIAISRRCCFVALGLRRRVMRVHGA